MLGNWGRTRGLGESLRYRTDDVDSVTHLATFLIMSFLNPSYTTTFNYLVRRIQRPTVGLKRSVHANKAAFTRAKNEEDADFRGGTEKE